MEVPVSPQDAIQQQMSLKINKIANTDGFKQMHLYPDTRSQQYSISQPINDLRQFSESFLLPTGNKTYLLDSCYLQVGYSLLFDVSTQVTQEGILGVHLGDLDTGITYAIANIPTGAKLIMQNQVWYAEFDNKRAPIATAPKNAMVLLDRSRINVQGQTPQEDIYKYRECGKINMCLDKEQENNRETWFVDQPTIVIPITNLPAAAGHVYYQYNGFFKIPLRYINSFFDVRNSQYLFTQYTQEPIQISLWFHQTLGKLLGNSLMFRYEDISVNNVLLHKTGINNFELQLYYTQDQDMTMCVQQMPQLVNSIHKYKRCELYQDDDRQTDINLPSDLSYKSTDILFGVAVKDPEQNDSVWLHQIWGCYNAASIISLLIQSSLYLGSTNQQLNTNAAAGFYKFVLDIGSGNALQDRAGYEQIMHFEADNKRMLGCDQHKHKWVYENNYYYNLIFNCFVAHSFRLLSLRDKSILEDASTQRLDYHITTQLGMYSDFAQPMTLNEARVSTIYTNYQHVQNQLNYLDFIPTAATQKIIEVYAYKDCYAVYGQNGTNFCDDSQQFIQSQE